MARRFGTFVARPAVAVLISSCIFLGVSAAAVARDSVGIDGGPVCPAPCSARTWNSAAIDYQARRIQAPAVVGGDFVQVGTWNAYLRLALLGNQDPYKRRYRNTYARCWTPSGWGKVSVGHTGLLGFYQPGTPWVNVPVTTCLNARKAARGELSATNVVALGTILHETFHRQGVMREDDATCLAAIGVWQAANRHANAARADRAWEQVIGWYKGHLDGAYRKGVEGCRERGVFAWNDSRVWR